MKTNFKRLKNIKIVQSIIIIVIISLLSTITIGVLGYINTAKMYNANIEMYKNVIPNLSDWGEVNGNMGVLRNTLTKIIDRPFDEANEKTMLELNKNITDIINKNVTLSENNSEEHEMVMALKEGYEHYYSFIPNIIEQRKNNIIPDAKITNVDMGVYGTEIAKQNTALIQYQKDKATTEINNSKSLYEKNIAMFISITGVSIVILALISIGIILMIRNSTKGFIHKVSVLSEGDFTVEFDNELSNEFGLMEGALGKTISSIANTISKIKDDSIQVNNNSISLTNVSEEMKCSIEEVSNAIQDVAKGSGEQASQLMKINNDVSSFGDKIEIITQSISKVDENTKNISNRANESDTKLKNLGVSMNEIATSYNEARKRVTDLSLSVDKITEITNMINGIAEQTNLLALNAAIEAARAGEAGRGFSIVADEIRKLAEQSKSSSQDINDLLSVISTETNLVEETTTSANEELKEQINIISETITSFREIVKSIDEIVPQVDEMNHSIIDIKKRKDNIIESVETSSAVSEENSASAEEITASSQEMEAAASQVSKSSEELKSIMQEIINQIEKFTL
ncbi:methyl-accepting chemotaxis protein [Clostridium beijerinckii]|nr:methyl-accepting chemotaxis protein [Clostridium beijerinckii]